MQVIGLGTQDDLDLAREFVDEFDLPFPMLWDESFESWQQLSVRAQPTAMLFSPEGAFQVGWQGRFPEDEVLSRSAEMLAARQGPVAAE